MMAKNVILPTAQQPTPSTFSKENVYVLGILLWRKMASAIPVKPIKSSIDKLANANTAQMVPTSTKIQQAASANQTTKFFPGPTIAVNVLTILLCSINLVDALNVMGITMQKNIPVNNVLRDQEQRKIHKQVSASVLNFCLCTLVRCV